MDELIRQEIMAAFEGLEESFADGDDDEAIALIQAQGATVFEKVLARLEDDGQLLSAQLSSRIETLAGESTREMLERYEERLGVLQEANNQARTELRSEIDNLNALSKEYDELMANKLGNGVPREAIVAGAAFLVGMSGVGAAANELLKMALGAGGDVQVLATNAILGVAGVGYYFYKKGQ